MGGCRVPPRAATQLLSVSATTQAGSGLWGVSQGREHAEQKPRWESQVTGDVRETSAPLGEPSSVRRTSCQQPAPQHGQCLGREVTPGPRSSCLVQMLDLRVGSPDP